MGGGGQVSVGPTAVVLNLIAQRRRSIKHEWKSGDKEEFISNELEEIYGTLLRPREWLGKKENNQ